MVKRDKSEIKVIYSHLLSVEDDLIHNAHRLEENGCNAEAKKLEMIIGKLESLCWIISKKA